MEKSYNSFWEMYHDLKKKIEPIEPKEVKPKKKKEKNEVQTD